MGTKNGFININLEITRELHLELKQKYKKMPRVFEDLYNLFAAMMPRFSINERNELKAQFPLIWKLINTMEKS